MLGQLENSQKNFFIFDLLKYVTSKADSFIMFIGTLGRNFKNAEQKVTELVETIEKT
jgi:hypothetical protein